MGKSVLLIFVMTSLLLSHCITANAQQPNSPVDIAASAKTVADSVAQITLPVSLPEGETVESYLLKQPGVHKDEEGNIIYPNGRKLTPEEIELSERDAHISWQDSLLKYQQKYQQQNK